MPKIIKNLGQTIRQKTFELFSEKGYEQVDIKLIAKECGMAVGTFYNYYRSKKELFMDILEESWKETFLELESVKKLNINEEEILKEEIKILYEGVEQRRGLGYYVHQKYTFNEMKSKEEELDEFNSKIICEIKKIFEPFEKKDSIKNFKYINEKIAQTLLIQITMHLSMQPELKMENLIFIQESILGLLKLDTK